MSDDWAEATVLDYNPPRITTSSACMSLCQLSAWRLHKSEDWKLCLEYIDSLDARNIILFTTILPPHRDEANGREQQG